MRNTLLFGFSVAILSRILSLLIGLVSGYVGGFTDRVLMSINDTFIVVPLFPLLVLSYFVMRDYMSWALNVGCRGIANKQDLRRLKSQPIADQAKYRWIRFR